MSNIKTRTTVNEFTPDCRYAVTWEITSKSKFDRPIAPEFYKTHMEAVERCQKEENEGNFIGKIKYIGSNHNTIYLD